MDKPKIAIISFPGNNCEVESIRAIRNNGMDAVFFRWNDSREKLSDVDGYFLPGGFSYEDRGRAGMVAGRDSLLDFIAEEASKGKVVIGNCNGAQILVESGLIPLDHELKMSLAKNVCEGEATGFLNEWVWITPTCKRSRCATSDWDAPMHIPIAHGEGRFTTKDSDLVEELKKNDQLAFSYCDEEWNVSEDPFVTPNGSAFAIAGICNPAGNVIALMPHPERTEVGNPYFASMKMWIENTELQSKIFRSEGSETLVLNKRTPKTIEIFIDKIITNNEERTVEQAARRIMPNLALKQLRYLAVKNDPKKILSTISLFNANKEVAYIRRGDSFAKWNPDTKQEEASDTILKETTLLRRDEPDTGVSDQVDETGICYVCDNVSLGDLGRSDLQEVFANPHASTLEVFA